MTTRRDSDLITAMHHLSWNTYSEVLQNRASILCALIQNAVRIDVCVISDAFSRIPFKVDVLILPFKLFHSHKKCSNSKLFLCTTRALFDLSWHIHGCCTRKKILREKYTICGGPAVFVAWEKNLCFLRKNICYLRKNICFLRKNFFLLEKKIFLSWEKNICFLRKKYFLREKKYFFLEKKYLFLEKKIFVGQFFRDLKVWFGGDAEMRMDAICKIMSQGAAPL